MEHPYLGLPLACAKELSVFKLLLSIFIELLRNVDDGTLAFHTLLLDDITCQGSYNLQMYWFFTSFFEDQGFPQRCVEKYRRQDTKEHIP